MAGKNNLITGITDLLVLAMLNKNDSYVYEITKTIEQASEGLLSISQNTIYTVTYKLEQENMISEYPKLVGRKRTRIYYHLEPAGKEYFNQLLWTYQNMTSGVHNILNSLQRGENDE
ncbi:MAG: PadR family transcriptional regulator [Lachnospiraceae bacterium]|nr:PadR family transcriptional regulator [Lachnospiraceae bacterium]